MRAFLLILILFPALALAEALSFAIIGDAGEWNVSTEAVRESIRKHNVTRLILPGDNLYQTKKNTYESVWSNWKGFTFDVVALGNHSQSYWSEKKFFNMPGEWYSKSLSKDVKFLVLNSDNQFFMHGQAGWLRGELEKASEPFVFVVYHHPSLTVHSGHEWKERKTFHNLIRPILLKYRSKITAVVVGHSHVASLLHFNDLPVVVSGAVHDPKPAEIVNNVQEEIKVRTAYTFNGTPFWVKLTVDGGKARFDFIRAQDNTTSHSACIQTGSEAKPCS